MQFTGERFIPGHCSLSMEQDHYARYEFALDYVKNKKVLDISCGAGYGAALMAETGATMVHGVDISPDTIEHARHNYHLNNLQFILGDICSYSGFERERERESYDVITCFETIEHVPDYIDALKNLRKLIKPDGLLIISSPNRLITSPHCTSLADRPGDFHFQEFTIDELSQQLMLMGFKVSDVYGQRQQPFFKNKLLMRIHKTLFKPKKNADPAVARVTNKAPRYIVITATPA